jgi:phosphatidylglycerophosphatase A
MEHGRIDPNLKVQRPSARLVLTTPSHLLAFGLGAGLSPVGPGTAGTLVAIPLWLTLQGLPWPEYLMVVAALFAAGCWICGDSARRLGVHDYGGIVFDEVVGFLATCIPLLPALGFTAAPRWPWVLAAFALFRLFDIWKPWPIGWFDRRVEGGFGIMLDDLLAAVYAAAVLAVAARAIPW